MKQSDIPSAQLVVSACEANGIQNIIISPGSRNAPLTLSFAENPFFRCFSIVDERSAAFFALGMALERQQPVAVVCTSGSALLNYYPAIAEAFYSTIPLVVISADRPPYKIDVGDGQTIRQDHVFHRHIGYSANLKLDISHATERIRRYQPKLLQQNQTALNEYNQKEVLSAITCALTKHLPVHVNVPFEEPLYDVIETTANNGFGKQPNGRLDENKEFQLADYKEIWANSSKKMVLVGVNYPSTIDVGLLDMLANDPSIIVMTETTSNLHHPNFFPSIDSIIFPIEKSANHEMLFEELRPEVLLTFGGLVVSKKIKAFLRQYQPAHHWHVDEIKAYDTYFSLSRHFRYEPNQFLTKLLSNIKPKQSNYFARWNQVKMNYVSKRKSYIEQSEYSDFTMFHTVLNSIPHNYQVHLANSSTVRYAQLFDVHPSLKMFCNRGTSGIDGSTSTAVGASFYHEQPTLLITGDLSFFYDSNALWNHYLKENFRIIIINNGGGGIFRILPGNDGSETFETYFETKQEVNVKFLCKQFGFLYADAQDKMSLKQELETFFDKTKQPKVLEVFTPRKLNDKILLGYFDFIS